MEESQTERERQRDTGPVIKVCRTLVSCSAKWTIQFSVGDEIFIILISAFLVW